MHDIVTMEVMDGLTELRVDPTHLVEVGASLAVVVEQAAMSRILQH